MTDTKELTDEQHEEKAREHGWVPKEEFKGPEGAWRSAKEFNERGDMIGNLIREQKDNSNLRAEINELKEGIKLLTEHNRKMSEIEREKAITALKDIKKEALKDGDVDTVVEVDDKIADIKAAGADTPSQDQGNTDPAAKAWLDHNPWYETDPVRRAAFNGIVDQVAKARPDLEGNVAGVLEAATQVMNQEFVTKRTQSGVTEPNEPAKKKSGDEVSASDLSYEQRQVAERMARLGGITVDEYAKQLAELGELQEIKDDYRD